MSVETSSFKETSYFLSEEPLHEKCSNLLMGFRIHPNESSEFFRVNWREVSGLGNLLLFLRPRFSVMKIRFFENECLKPRGKKGNTFHFLVIIEISHRQEDLIYLLDYVQKARNGDHVGLMEVYEDISEKVGYRRKKSKSRNKLSQQSMQERKPTRSENFMIESYSCLFCGKIFSYFSDLQRHMQMHHTHKKDISTKIKRYEGQISEEIDFLTRYLSFLKELNLDSKS